MIYGRNRFFSFLVILWILATCGVVHAEEHQYEGKGNSPFLLHRDTYLLFGYSNSALNEELTFKFQISAKLEIPLPGLYFAYTQRSFLDVLADSLPFTDHNFEPEAFYRHRLPASVRDSSWLDYLQLGYRHQSNGRDGTESRSWERFYLQAGFEERRFVIRPTVWLPFFEEEENSNIEEFWGYGELYLAYVWKNDIQLSGIFRVGTDLPNGNLRVDATFPLKLFFRELPQGWMRSNLWFQVFHGYGETFLGFNESSTAVAFGFGFRPRL